MGAAGAPADDVSVPPSEPAFSFRKAFDAAPDALLIIDDRGLVVSVNERTRDLFGPEVDAVVGQPMEVLIPAWRSEGAQHPTVRRFDGTEVAVEIALSPLEAAVGRFVLCVVRDVSERLELESRNNLLAALVSSSDDAIAAADVSGIVIEWNRGSEGLSGYTTEEMVGEPLSRLAPTEALAKEQDRMRETAIAGQPVRVDTKRRRKDGTVFDTAVRYSPILTPGGDLMGYSIIARDITERVRMVDELTLRAQLLDTVDAAVVATDLVGIVRHWNRRAEELYGCPAEEVIGRGIAELPVGAEAAELQEDILARIRHTGSWEGIVRTTRKDGTSFPALVRAIPYAGPDGRAAGVLGVAVDMTERLAVEEDLRSTRDLLEAITENIGEGLLVIDRDGRITYANHVAAELVGRSHPELLRTSITELFATDTSGSRAVLAALQPETGTARLDADFVTRADGSRLAVDVTSSPMRQADGPRWALVMADDSERRARVDELKRELEATGYVGRITDALSNDSLLLDAQPIMRLDNGEIRHRELLVRLRSADGTIISPARFLPAAEKHGLIIDIDRWVIGRGLRIAAAGSAVAINLSAATLGATRTHACIADQIAHSDVDPAKLMFEITETAMLGDLEAGQQLVRRLADLGCQVALDDFGTGYGGFTYLKHLPVGVLKIDIEFVQDLTISPASRHVVSAVVGLARSFGLETIAEGVEDEETLDVLRELGVDLAQGYFIGRPEPVDTRLTAPELDGAAA